MAVERPPEPSGTDEIWYRGWECGYDDMAARYVPDAWRAYKGGCDLDAPQISAKTWVDLLDEIDNEEDDAVNIITTRWKAAHSVDGDQFAIYPDTGKMEFPVAVKPQYVRDDLWQETAERIVRLHNADLPA